MTHHTTTTARKPEMHMPPVHKSVVDWTAPFVTRPPVDDRDTEHDNAQAIQAETAKLWMRKKQTEPVYLFNDNRPEPPDGWEFAPHGPGNPLRINFQLDAKSRAMALAVDLLAAAEPTLAGPAVDAAALNTAWSGRGIGDINSTAKGSGARFNSGKPDMSLLPLWLLVGIAEAREYEDTALIAAVNALRGLAFYQETQDVKYLYLALDALDPEQAAGWKECCDVFTYGARKYLRGNWLKGMNWSVPLACAARHIWFGILDGEANDAESGLSHRGHFYCNVTMLLQYAKTYPEGNDLPAIGLL
jgi:hypothetical protein